MRSVIYDIAGRFVLAGTNQADTVHFGRAGILGAGKLSSRADTSPDLKFRCVASGFQPNSRFTFMS